MKKTKKIHGRIDCFLIIILSIFLGYLILKDVKSLDQIIVLDDEFGYWANAASLIGKDWRYLLGYTGYYSYGYSLLLIPLFLIVKTPSTMYAGAIVLNYIFLLISFWGNIYLTNLILKESKIKRTSICIAFIATIYISNMIQSQYAWSENLLYMLIVLLSCFLYKYIEKPSIVLGGIIALLSIYAYAVHQRSLVILIALICICFLLFFRKSSEKKNIVFLIFGILILLGLTFFLKNIITGFYDNGSLVEINNYSGQVGKVYRIFTVEGIIQYLKNAIGSFFYLSISSYFVIPLGVIYCLRNIFKGIKNGEQITLIYIFWCLILLGSIAISSIFINEPLRIDMTLYGRYVDYITAPFLIMGYLELWNSFRYGQKSLGIIFLNICMMTIVNIEFSKFDISSYNSFGSCGISKYMFDSPVKSEILFHMVLLASVIFLIITFLFQKVKSEVVVLSLAIIVILNINQYNQYNLYVTQRLQNELRESIYPIAETINYMDEKLDVYVVYDDLHGEKVRQTEELNNKIKYLQFLLPNKSIKGYDYSKAESIEKGYFVVYTNSLLHEEGKLGEISEVTDVFKLYIKK